MNKRKLHWDRIYQYKSPEQVSWTQAIPQTSLKLIDALNLSKDAHIIDVGGGDSNLVDFLLANGYQNLTVLDISNLALERARKRLGKIASRVNWVVSDINDFIPEDTYDLWHDRAVFHFLTTPQQISNYVNTAAGAVAHYLVVGTFSDKGPGRCSGLPVKRYSKIDLQHTLAPNFRKIRCLSENHRTPFKTVQHFTFCSFEKV